MSLDAKKNHEPSCTVQGMGLCIALPVQLFKITISDFFLLKEEITEGCITHCAIVGIYKDCSFIAICSSFEGLWGCSFKAIFHPPGRRDCSFIVLFHPLGRPDCSVIAICSSSIGLWDCSFIVIFVILYTVGLWDCSFIDIFSSSLGWRWSPRKKGTRIFSYKGLLA